MELYCEDLNVYGYVWGKLFILDIIKKNNIYFNTDMYSQEDLDFMLSYYNYCKKFYLIDYIGYYYDFEISNRKAPFLDFIKNQLKLYSLSIKYTYLSKKGIEQIQNRIDIFIYHFLYCCNTKNDFFINVSVLETLEKLNQFIQKNDINKKKKSLFLFSKKKYTELYYYIKIKKIIIKTKDVLKGRKKGNGC